MKGTDLIVFAAVVVGTVVALAGLSQLDPRVRERLGRGEATMARTAALAGGLVLVGLIIVGIALGGGE